MKPLTGPMQITLVDARDRSMRPSRALYPGGQMRLIMSGLIDRGLIDVETGLLTTEGQRLAFRLARPGIPTESPRAPGAGNE